MIRQELEKILGEEIRVLAIQTRERIGVTQREMGELLFMSESSYSDIETGVTTCASALTVILLMQMQDDNSDSDNCTGRFLNHLARRFDETLQPI